MSEQEKKFFTIRDLANRYDMSESRISRSLSYGALPEKFCRGTRGCYLWRPEDIFNWEREHGGSYEAFKQILSSSPHGQQKYKTTGFESVNQQINIMEQNNNGLASPEVKNINPLPADADAGTNGLALLHRCIDIEAKLDIVIKTLSSLLIALNNSSGLLYGQIKNAKTYFLGLEKKQEEPAKLEGTDE